MNIFSPRNAFILVVAASLSLGGAAASLVGAGILRAEEPEPASTLFQGSMWLDPSAQDLDEHTSIRRILHFEDHAAIPTDDAFGRLGLDVFWRFASIPAVTVIGPVASFRLLESSWDGVTIEDPGAIEYLLETAVFTTRAGDVWGDADWPSDPGNFPRLEADGLPINGTGVTVAVVDSGANGLHPDLFYKPLEVPGVTPPGHLLACVNLPQAQEAAASLPDCDQDVGHGTHVSGIIAGNGWAAKNGLIAEPWGTYYDGRPPIGVAPGADLVVVGIGVETVALGGLVPFGLEGLDWVYQHADEYGIKVVNNSWGTTETCATTLAAAMAGTGAQISAALVRDKDMNIVWAAGNSGSSADHGINPYGAAPVPGLITVANYWDMGSIDRDAEIADSSSDGCTIEAEDSKDLPWMWPDVAAPGTNILAAYAYGTVAPTLYQGLELTNAPGLVTDEYLDLNFCEGFDEEYPGLGYCFPFAAAPFYVALTGTSMATPHVAGIVALMRQANPDLSPEVIEHLLVSSATPWDDAIVVTEPDPAGIAAPTPRADPGPFMWGSNAAAGTFSDPSDCYINEGNLATFDGAAYMDPSLYACRDFKRGRGLVDAYEAVSQALALRGEGVEANVTVTSPTVRMTSTAAATVTGTFDLHDGATYSGPVTLTATLNGVQATTSVTAGQDVPWTIVLGDLGTLTQSRVLDVVATTPAGEMLGRWMESLDTPRVTCDAPTTWATDAAGDGRWNVSAIDLNGQTDLLEIRAGMTANDAGTACDAITIEVDVGPFSGVDATPITDTITIDFNEPTGPKDYVLEVTEYGRNHRALYPDGAAQLLENGVMVAQDSDFFDGPTGGIRLEWIGDTIRMTFDSALINTDRFDGFTADAEDGIGYFITGPSTAVFETAKAHDSLTTVVPFYIGSGFTPVSNNEPVLATIGAKSGTVGVEIAFTVSASDADADTLTYALGTDATGATFDTGSGAFQWTPASVGTFWGNFSVSDGNGGSDWENVTFTIADAPNQEPVLSVTGTMSVTAGGTIHLAASTTDGDGDTLSYMFTTNATGGSFQDGGSGSATFDWTTSTDDVGEYWANVSVSDGNGGMDWDNVTLTVAASNPDGEAGGDVANVAPVVADLSTDAARYKQGSPITVQVTATVTDANGADNITSITASYTDPDTTSTDVAAGDITVVAESGSATNWTVSFSLSLPADAMAGAWGVTVAAADGVEETTASVAFDIVRPLELGYDGGRSFLDFGTFQQGQSAASENNFTVSNNQGAAVDVLFDMTDFTRNEGGADTIPVRGNAVLNIDTDGDGAFDAQVAYEATTQSMGTIPDGATWTVQVVLTTVYDASEDTGNHDGPLAAGTYAATFGVTEL